MFQNHFGLSIDHPDFYSKAFSLVLQKQQIVYSHKDEEFFLDEYDALSKSLEASQLQNPSAVRGVLRSRYLANLLIDEEGEIRFSLLPKLIEFFKTHLYSLGPNRQYDVKRQEHLLRVLILLNTNKEIARLIKSIDQFVFQKKIDELIRNSLQLPTGAAVTTAHFRRAILSAWMCILRQSVGSCFATAPGIMIHDEQPELFLKDLVDLLTIGSLKRTFGGVEYSVPLSMSSGAGDLKKIIQLNLRDDFNENAIWYSPGIKNAFLAIGLIDSTDTHLPAQIRENVFHAIIEMTGRKKSFLFITVEEIIRLALLSKLELKKPDLAEYEKRPIVPMQRDLVVLTPVAKSAYRSKDLRCETFFTQFKIACEAFKALSDHALLKTWEYTIASFAETKSQFTRWNLYSSLGLEHEEEGGIGSCIYGVVKDHLDLVNRKVQESQIEYEQLFLQLKAVESRMKSATTEKETNWIRAEYQAKQQEFYSVEEMRNEMSLKAERLSGFYSLLIERYDALFPLYFQEVYDADMHDVTAGPYNDSPAGFRLLYKHGRANVSQWSYIHTPPEFIEALVSFFTLTENELSLSVEFEGFQMFLSEVVTKVITLVRTTEFLESAFHRMAVAHGAASIKNPLQHLDQIEKKPWAYTSGGTINTFLCCYYRLEDKPKESLRWVESPFELCVFLIDTIRQLPLIAVKRYLEVSPKMMLMHSPTHAFLLNPQCELFKEGWKSDLYTYTWVRDTIVNPRKEFIDSMWLNKEMMTYLVAHLSIHIPEEFRRYFLQSFESLEEAMRPYEFRDYVLKEIQGHKGMQPLNKDLIDVMLYQKLPLFSSVSMKERLENLYQTIVVLSPKQRHQLSLAMEEYFPPLMLESVVDAESLQNICKGLMCLAFAEIEALGGVNFGVNYHLEVSQAARELGYALPAPFIFGDTNWEGEEFAFVVNPGNCEFELWRVDFLGKVGAPMSSWKMWLDGSRKEPKWGIYTGI